MTKAKILFIMHMPPPIHGAAMMGQYIHDSKLINEKFDCHYINPSLSVSVDNVGKVNLGKIWFMIKNTLNIIKTIRKLKPNLCYYTPTSDGWGIYRDFLIVKLLEMQKQKIIFHMHNKGVNDYSKKHFIARVAYKNIFRNAKVILLAKDLYQDIKKYVPDNRVYYCPNGMPVTNYEHFERTSINNPYTFLFLSNMIEEKGVIDLLRACALIKEKNLSFKCNFVGRWSTVSEERFTTIVRELGLCAHVNYLGAKYGADKVKILKKSDALVFPSHGETFGLVLLEAMEYGMPCISTNVGGIPSVVDDKQTGFLIQVRDVDSLAEKMSYFIQNPESGLIMGQAGKRKFLEEFTLNVFEHNLSDILSMEIRH